MDDATTEATTTTVDPDDLADTSPADRAADAFDDLRSEPQPEHKGWPKGKKRGTCQACGNPADSPSGTWCAVDRPVRRDTAPRPRRPSERPSATPKSHPIAGELRVQLELVAQLWAIKDPVCANVLREQAKPIADYWGARARASDRVARVLDGVVSSGGWLGALSVHAPLALVVFAHHVQPAIAARNAGGVDDDQDVTYGPAGPAWGPDPDPTTEDIARPWEIRDDGRAAAAG